MAGGLFSRLKVWLEFETFFNIDINGELNNIINNLQADKLSGTSDTIPEMKTVFDPGDLGTENQPQSVAEEIQALRFQVRAIINPSEVWYEDPPTSLKDIDDTLESIAGLENTRLVSGRINGDRQPDFILPNGTGGVVDFFAATTNLSTVIDGAQVVFSSDLSISGLTVAPSTNNTALVNDTTLVGQEASKVQGERNTTILIDTVGSEITSRDEQIAAFKINNGVDDEFFIGEIDVTNGQLKNCLRGYFFDDVGSHVPRITINNNDTITFLRLTWLFIVDNGGTGVVEATFNQPFVQVDTPTTPAAGDFWFDLTLGIWKKFVGASFVDANAVFIGLACQDDTDTVGARAVDFSLPYSNLNTLTLSLLDANTVRSTLQNNRVSVYGNPTYFEKAFTQFIMPGDLDSGESETINTDYYLYLTDQGDTVLSTVAPHDRKEDLLGEYHPAKPYRAIGIINNDGSSDFDANTLEFIPYNPGFLEDKNLFGKTTPGFGVDAPLGQEALTSSSGIFSTVSATYVAVTNLSIKKITKGHLVRLVLSPEDAIVQSRLFLSRTGTSGPDAFGRLRFLRDGVQICEFVPGFSRADTAGGGTLSIGYMPGAFELYHIPPGKGEFTWSCEVRTATTATTFNVDNVRLLVQDL